MRLDSNVYDFSDHQCAEELRHDAADEHFFAQRIGEQQHQVVRVHFVNDGEERGRQGQEHDAGEAAFTGEGLDLSPDLEAFAHEVADLVQNFGKITARLSLQDDRRGEELQVEVRDALGEAGERLVERLAKVLLFERSA